MMSGASDLGGSDESSKGRKPLMLCGHAANATQKLLFPDAEGRTETPVCAICVGLKEGATQVAEKALDLSNRLARCSCGRTRPSSLGLAFFEYKPELSNDVYYCGCRGWD
jgi:hypothetical protein